MKKRILILGLITAFNANAANTCGDDLNNNCWDCSKTADDSCTARLDGTKLTITGSGEMKDYDWFSEDNKAPWGTDVTSADISGVSSVGNYAFKFAKELTDVRFSDSVKSLGFASFDTTGLENITLPEKLEIIGNYAFSSSAMRADEIIIPDSVTTIGAYAFQDSRGLKSIVIGDGVETIGAEAFTRIHDRTVIYCEDNQKRSCADLINENNSEVASRLKVYTTDKNGYIRLGDKIYASLNDLPRYVLRRIYTLEEANAVAGDKNRVSIKYR